MCHKLEQEESPSLLLLRQVLIDNLIAGCLVGEPAASLVYQEAVFAFWQDVSSMTVFLAR